MKITSELEGSTSYSGHGAWPGSRLALANREPSFCSFFVVFGCCCYLFFVFAFLRSPFIHVALDDALAIHLERVIFHLSCLYSNLTADESSLAQPLAIISLPAHTNLVVNDDEFR